uniref:Uncharacterized protein n=1 Tax=Lactuca sativa TaxID=4236 RepID=A0A9R1XWH7_LACSA|nr:hypothetical protein LSAT_V11C100035640 [Lactuca sativa]
MGGGERSMQCRNGAPRSDAQRAANTRRTLFNDRRDVRSTNMVDDRGAKVEEGTSVCRSNHPRHSYKALIGSGATHNFISVDEAKRLGINYVKGGGSIKDVNSTAKPVTGVLHQMEAKIGQWKVVINVSVVPMNDFQLVLRPEFFNTVCAFPMPFASSLCIIDGVRTCIVSRERRKSRRDYTSTKEVPIEIERFLKEFQDVMPKELPKKLQPRVEVDHDIDLELGSKPPSTARYRMAPPELEELHKKLKEVLDASYIRPSKAPFGAPIVFQRNKN